MISHLVATALTTVAVAATSTGQPAEYRTGESISGIGTAISIVGGQAPANLEVGNALALVGNATKAVVR